MAISKHAWVKLVLHVDPDRPQTLQQPAAAAPQPAMAAAPGAEAKAGAPPEAVRGGSEPQAFAAPIIPIIIGGAKLLLGELTATVTIVNATSDATLTLDGAGMKLKSGEYKSGRPAGTLKPGDHTQFVVHSTPVVDIPIPLLQSLIPNVNHCEGTIRYLAADGKTAISCYFINPRNITDPLGTNDAKGSVTGPGAANLKIDPKKTHGSDGTFDFTVTGAGGGQPTPDGPGSGVAASCRVGIVNQTQQMIYLRKQDKAAGDYVTNPQTSIAPGGRTDFVFAETPNSKDHGCRGLMTWEVADPRQAKWDLMWDNQKGAKNLSASFLDPKDAPFHTLDQIDQGDENVPVTFTLSAGGAGPKPDKPTDKPTNSIVTVTNDTDVPLKLRDQTAHAGKFTRGPPAVLEPKTSAVITFSGPDDFKEQEMGSLEWQVGEDDDWYMFWTNPRGDDNEASGSLEKGAGISDSYHAGAGDQDVHFTFRLSGKAGPVPGKEPTSCAIMVSNQTTSVLTLSGQKAEQGEFRKAPPRTIAAGSSALVTFVGPKEDPAQGAQGSINWDLGDPPVSTWTVAWENPPGAPNAAEEHLNPSVEGISTDSTVEKGDDDVAYTFTISGDAAGPQPTEADFLAPPKSKQPTLRKGDKSPDGWVEYAQGLLNKYGATLEVNGEFGAAMVAAVKDFQGKNHGQVDGVIGNETWSLLRHGPKEVVGTDGRTPHSFEQKDAQARFAAEDSLSAAYYRSADTFNFVVISTGEQPIDKNNMTMRVTQPDKSAHTVKMPIGSDIHPSPDGQGNAYYIHVKSFTKLFKLAKGVDPLACLVDAYLDGEIGGDRWTGNPVEGA